MSQPHASTSSSTYRNGRASPDRSDDDDGGAAFTEARADLHHSSDDSDHSDDEQDDSEDWHDPSELAVSGSQTYVTLLCFVAFADPIYTYIQSGLDRTSC